MIQTKTKRKLLIFDLDETLVHSISDLTIEHDVEIKMKNVDNKRIVMGLNVRPHARKLL